MKAHVIKFIAQSIKNLLGILAGLFTTLIFFTVLPKAWGVPLFWTGNANNPATAGSGTWETSTPSGPVSWSSTPGTTNTPVPWTDGSVAHFQGSFGGTATLGSNISAAGINFDVGANAFAISTNGNTLTIQGVGIVNNSGQTQTITNNGAGGSGTFFLGTSTAGNAAITNNGPAVNGATGGRTVFNDTSTAGNATITNNGGTGGVTGGVTGETFFSGTSTAGNAAITNNGGTVSGLAGGEMQFLNTSTAGNAAITNNGGAVSGAGGGLTLFGSTSTAGNATITNSGGAVSGAFGGATQFLNASTAGNATITNSGGSTLFTDTSTAGNATIINNNGALGGLTRFLKSSDGGTARAITDGNGSFDISGLTTAGMGIGSIEGSGNYFLGSKALSAGGNNLSTTVSGVIQDGSSPAGPGGVGGSLTKVGTGTLTLTGANTYTGGTNLNGGILAVNSDSNLGTGLLTFNGGTLEALAAGGGLVSSKPITLNAGGGTFLADTGTTSILSGAIGGVGAWTKTGPGTLTLSAANTYSGGTNLNGGILAVNSNGSLGTGPLSFNGGTLEALAGITSTKAITLNAGGGAFLADTGSVSTLSGAITGAGAWTKAGPGILVLTGANTYGGGTTISAGTLQIGNGGTTGSITGKVIDNGVLAFNRSDSVTFSGVISGAGSLVKQGAGSLTLPEKNTYTGATIINAGSLIVDGSIASQQTFVNAGAFLGGHGTIGGNLSNSGIVGPGNSPGTLTVANDYTQNATGTLRIQVGGLAANQHDLLAVNGHVTLGGTLQLVRLGSFNLQPGNQIVFLTAKNGVSGAFNTVQNDFVTGTTVQGVVTSSANAIVLEGTQGSFTQIPGINTPNQSAVGNMLNSAVGNPAAAPLFAFLDSQPVANLPHDYNLIAPTQISSFHATGAAHGNTQIANLGGRMASIRAGITGFSSLGFTLNGSVASSGEGFAGVTGPEGKSGPSVLAPTPDNRWGVFVTGIGEFTNVDSTQNAAGYDIDTGGVTFGVDYRVCPFFAIGLSAGYAHTKVNIDSAGGHIDVSSGKFGLYATAFTQGFYVDAAVSGGPSGYKSDRSALQGTASGSTDSGDLNALVATGYDWKFGGLTIGPTASFQYGYIGLNAFTETGSLAPLKFPDQTSESERTAFGVKTSYDWKVGHVDVLPEFRAAWQHEYGDTEYSIISNLASGAGNSFTVTGPPIGRDSLLIGVGAAVVWNDRVTTYIYYDGEFARTNYLSNNVSAGVRVTF